MSDYRSKLGVDYLKQSAPEKRSSQSTLDFINEAVLLYGAKILGSIAKAPKGERRLHEVIQELDISITVALQVVDYLKSQELIEIPETDKFGNHLLVITMQGRKMVGQKAL